MPVHADEISLSKRVHSVVQSPLYNLNSRNFALKPTVKSGKAEEQASPGPQEPRFELSDRANRRERPAPFYTPPARHARHGQCF